MKKVLGFTLVEIIIAVSIIAIASTVGATSWRYAIVRAEFNQSVSEIISVFQQARSYSSKSVEIDGNYYTSFRVRWLAGGGTLNLEGRGAVNTTLDQYTFDDVLEISGGNFWVEYEVPYSYANTSTGNDIQFTVTSTKWDMSKDIIIHNISGIAETVE